MTIDELLEEASVTRPKIMNGIPFAPEMFERHNIINIAGIILRYYWLSGSDTSELSSQCLRIWNLEIDGIEKALKKLKSTEVKLECIRDLFLEALEDSSDIESQICFLVLGHQIYSKYLLN